MQDSLSVPAQQHCSNVAWYEPAIRWFGYFLCDLTLNTNYSRQTNTPTTSHNSTSKEATTGRKRRGPWVLGWRPFSSKQADRKGSEKKKNAATLSHIRAFASILPGPSPARITVERPCGCATLQVRETKHRCGWLAMLVRSTIAYFPDASQQLGGRGEQRKRKRQVLMGGC